MIFDSIALGRVSLTTVPWHDVSGVTDEAVSEKHQLFTDLSLERHKRIVKTWSFKGKLRIFHYFIKINKYRECNRQSVKTRAIFSKSIVSLSRCREPVVSVIYAGLWCFRETQPRTVWMRELTVLLLRECGQLTSTNGFLLDKFFGLLFMYMKHKFTQIIHTFLSLKSM